MDVNEKIDVTQLAEIEREAIEEEEIKDCKNNKEVRVECPICHKIYSMCYFYKLLIINPKNRN